MENIRSNDYFETTDLALASFLLAIHASLVDIGQNNQHKKTFVFDPGPPKHVISGFYDGSEKVSAKKLMEAYEKLKVATGVYKSNGG